MPIFPPPSALILVGVMPNPRDLEIARILGWYRIPFRFAPKVVNVDFLAFYQTAAFGEEMRWQIRCFAPVTGHELTTRAELFRDQPDHPGQMRSITKSSWVRCRNWNNPYGRINGKESRFSIPRATCLPGQKLEMTWLCVQKNARFSGSHCGNGS